MVVIHAGLQNWSEAEKLQQVLSALRGPSQEAIMLLDRKKFTFNSLMEHLEICFGNIKPYNDVMDELELWRECQVNVYMILLWRFSVY